MTFNKWAVQLTCRGTAQRSGGGRIHSLGTHCGMLSLTHLSNICEKWLALSLYHTGMHSLTHTHRHAWMHACMCTHTHTHTLSLSHTHTCTLSLSLTHTLSHTHTHTLSLTHAHTHILYTPSHSTRLPLIFSFRFFGCQPSGFDVWQHEQHITSYELYCTSRFLDLCHFHLMAWNTRRQLRYLCPPESSGGNITLLEVWCIAL